MSEEFAHRHFLGQLLQSLGIGADGGMVQRLVAFFRYATLCDDNEPSFGNTMWNNTDVPLSKGSVPGMPSPSTHMTWAHLTHFGRMIWPGLTCTLNFLPSSVGTTNLIPVSLDQPDVLPYQ